MKKSNVSPLIVLISLAGFACTSHHSSPAVSEPVLAQTQKPVTATVDDSSPSEPLPTQTTSPHGTPSSASGSSLVNKMATNLNFNIDSLDEGSLPTLHFKNMQVMVTPNNLRMVPLKAGASSFTSTDNTVDVTVEEVFVNEVIRQKVHGVTANIFIQASCRGVVAKFTDRNSLLSGVLSPKAGGGAKGKMQLSNPVVKVSAPQFQMTTSSCDGAQGFAEMIESTVREDLQNHQLMDQLIQDNLISQMTKFVDDSPAD